MKKLLPLVISTVLGFSHSALAEDISQIYNQAKETNPSLLQARAAKDQAFEAINTADAANLPQINLTASSTYIDHVSGDRMSNTTWGGDSLLSNSASLSVSQAIFNRANWETSDISELSARASDAQYASAQQQLIYDTVDKYFAVLGARDNLKFVQAEKKAVARQLEQTKQRFNVGLSAITDVHSAQAQYDAVLAQEIAAQNTLTNSYEALRELAGEYYRDLDDLDTSKLVLKKPASDIDELIKTAEDKNLNILALKLSKEIAKKQISLADKNGDPTLSLVGSYGYTGSDMELSGTNTRQSGTNASIGLNFNMPLYTGGSITSNVKQKEFAYVSASQQLQATHRTVETGVHTAYNNINADIAQIKAYEQAVVSAQSSLKATEAGFEVGTRTIVDVLDATQTLYQQKENLSAARYNYIRANLALKQAQGTLSEEDILTINALLK